MRSLALYFCALSMSGCLSVNVLAETTGWSWGPFTSSTTKSTVANISTESKSSSSWMPHWKMPDVVGSVKKTANSVTKSTSNAWKSATRTTKRAWKKTTEVLDPFPNDPKSVGSSSSSSSRGSSSWFGGSKKIEKPATPQDFLRQERP